MSYEIPCDIQMPYLRAIQKIPGNIRSEKLNWIGRLIHQTSNVEQLPPELLPILRVETAIKKKRHEDITWALKCEDSTIINRILKASWVFDGSHKETINVSYFCDRILPYVSVDTRTRIVLALAHRLSGKDPVFAQQMFIAVLSIYNIQTAYPLIIACDETFAYETIVEKELILPITITKKIFRKNPDLIVRFLKLLKPRELNATERSPFAIGIHKYESFLPKLIKKRLQDFIELCEIHKAEPPNIVLSNKCTEIFLKKAQEHLIKNPLLYIHMLPPKKINNLMESIFPGLLPTEISSFGTDSMLNYLEHYPHDKKYDLLRKSYKNKYHANLLDEMVNVTPALLQLLPTEERIKQAKLKIEKQTLLLEETNNDYTTDYKTAWICYLPINEVIPVIKEKINKTPNETDRLSLIIQMIYSCKINGDDNALSDTLTYFLKRHKNENSWLFEQMFHKLLQIYDVPHLNKKQISLVLDIVRLFYIKNGYASEEILTPIIHCQLIHGMPIEELINMFLGNQWYLNFNILQEYPQYERQCLVTFANAIQKKSFNNFNEKNSNFCRFVTAIFDFNNRCKKSHVKIEKMTIKDYPWVMDTILEVIRSKEDSWYVEEELQKNEPELYRSWLPENIVNVTSGMALTLLNHDLQYILNNWEKYLADCMKNCRLKSVQHFVKATRWYKDLPIKFADCCMNNIYDKNIDKISPSVVILTILLHGDTVEKLINPLIPTETTINTSHPNAKDDYKILQNLPLSMRLANPPVPLDLVVRLCEGDYLSIALATLTNVSKRTSLPKVIAIVQKLMTMRVSTRKHGIRLMCLVASMRELTNFLQKTWATESHHSVRQVSLKAFQNLFLTKPNPETWSLYCQAMSTLNLKDENLLSDSSMFFKIPNEYVVKFFDLRLKTIDNLRGMGLDIQKTNNYIADCLGMLTESIFNLLPEEFAENILRKFLFHIDTRVSETARHFTISYILSVDKDKYTACIKVFADVFHNTVITFWNVPHPKKLHFHPLNKAVRLFVDDFVVSYVNKFCLNDSTNLEVIDNMQSIFLSVLSPRQDARSYLLLMYAKKLQECTLTKSSFGLKLGQQLHELTDIFSSLLISFMTDVLKYFLSRVYKHPDLEKFQFSIIEDLIETGNSDACFMAVLMLPSTIQTKHVARYDQIIEKFRRIEEPFITVLYDHLNETNLQIID
ncbi:PREDICTED: uncharacterized protein LOC105555794 [Vollenhovia emeryi]|uniref:uncharacterized protein LOC105555794 n=1 Tax=Vollenhovia emeryi TaxID=411798 RepID=UPI0005F4DB30|nr:PREDICTED: uncharacterized protein LOC105555794 [Vollenhovia emeryi]